MFEKTDRSARKGRLWRTGAAVTAALTFGALAAGVGTAGATAAVTVQRIAGVNRYATAAQIALAKYPTGAGTAILTSGLNFPDALAAGYLAGLNAAPILLTDPNTLSPETQQALSALHTANVIILGGTQAVSASIATAVSALTSTSAAGGNIQVSRIFGASRYDTMQAIDTSAPATAVGVVDGKATAIIAQGLNFADALSASALAFKSHLPIVLTDPNTLISQAQQTLQTLNIGQVIIMGGTAAIAPAVESAINALGITTLARFSGIDRTDTAQQLAQYEVQNLNFTNTEVVLTRGDNYPDALAGGVYAGDPKPILESEDPNTLGQYLTSYLQEFAASIQRITILGGESAFSDAAAVAAQTAAGSNGAGGAGNVGAGGGNVGGGGGNGGPGGVLPGPVATTAGAPDLTSASILVNGFNGSQPSIVQYNFDKAISAVLAPAGGLVLPPNGLFHIVGPDTTNLSGSVQSPQPGPPPLMCVPDTNGFSVDCQYSEGVNVSAFTMAEADGGAVSGGASNMTNNLNTVTLTGGNNEAVGQPVLVPNGCVVPTGGDPFNELQYTFNQAIANTPPPNPQDFGFVTLDGQTEWTGASTVATSTNTVTATFTPGSGVAEAEYCFVLPGGVVGASSGVPNVITDAGSLPANRPNVVSVTRTASPNQFIYTFDKPSIITTGGGVTPSLTDFVLFQATTSIGVTAQGGSVTPETGNTGFLVTFPAAQVTAANTSTFVWGAAAQNCLGANCNPIAPFTNGPGPNAGQVGAVNLLSSPFTANAVGAVAIGGGTTAIPNGPVLQTCSIDDGSSQATYTFDRPVNQVLAAGGGGVPDFFLVSDTGIVDDSGAAQIPAVNNNIIIKFAPVKFGIADAVGCGITGVAQFEGNQNGGFGPPVGGATVTDTAGNIAVGATVQAVNTP